MFPCVLDFVPSERVFSPSAAYAITVTPPRFGEAQKIELLARTRSSCVGSDPPIAFPAPG